MKGIIVTYHYSPEITPRAFRASSIYNTFIELGHEVELITPVKQYSNAKGGSKASLMKTVFRKIAEKLLPGGKDLRFFMFFIRNLKNKNVDFVVSVGLPFSVHLATAIAIRFFGLTANKVIFDYGDPYSANPNGNHCFYARLIEKWTLKSCDYVLTPVKDAVKLFEKIIPENCKVEVVPQGYNIKDVEISVYNKNSVPTFCYAGILYKNLREPDNFLKYLAGLKQDYKFVVYTSMNSFENMAILEKYKDKMIGKLDIRPMIPRDECLKVLSKMDFLVNFANQGGVQQPSKLVDYTLSKRPYLTIENNQTDFSYFNDFFESNFDSFKPMDISSFDKDEVAKKIIDLASRS